MKSKKNIYSKKSKIQKNIKKKNSKNRKNYVRKTKLRTNISLRKKNNKKKTKKNQNKKTKKKQNKKQNKKTKSKLKGGTVDNMRVTRQDIPILINTFVKKFVETYFKSGDNVNSNFVKLFYPDSDFSQIQKMQFLSNVLESKDNNLTNFNKLCKDDDYFYENIIKDFLKEPKTSENYNELNKLSNIMQVLSFTWDDWKQYLSKQVSSTEDYKYHTFRNKIVNIFLLKLYYHEIYNCINENNKHYMIEYNITLHLLYNGETYKYIIEENKNKDSKKEIQIDYYISGLGSNDPTSDYDISLVMPNITDRDIPGQHKSFFMSIDIQNKLNNIRKSFRTVIVKVFEHFDGLFQNMSLKDKNLKPLTTPQLSNIKFDTNLYIHPIHINYTINKNNPNVPKFLLKTREGIYIPNPANNTLKLPIGASKSGRVSTTSETSNKCPLEIDNIYGRELNNANLHLLIKFKDLQNNKNVFIYNDELNNKNKNELEKHFYKLCKSTCDIKPAEFSSTTCVISDKQYQINYEQLCKNNYNGLLEITYKFEEELKKDNDFESDELEENLRSYFAILHKLLHYADETYYSVSAFIHVVELLQAKNQILFNELINRQEDFKNILKISIIDQFAFILDAVSKYNDKNKLKKKISKYFARLYHALDSFRKIQQQTTYDQFKLMGNYTDIMKNKYTNNPLTPDTNTLFKAFNNLNEDDDSFITNFLVELYKEITKDKDCFKTEDLCIKLNKNI